MKTDHSSFFKATAAFTFTLYTLALGCTFFVGSEAKAADAYEECRQILAQDIFNRISTSNSNNSASSSAEIATFFSLDETEAYEKYMEAFDEAKKNRTEIDVEAHYAFIGGQLGIDLNSENLVSQSEFNEKFNRAKSSYQSSTSSTSSSSQALINNYASYVRDSNTVNAWKECVTKTRETNIYAFASRDRAGKTYINVMWVPGPLAGSVPSIPISFVTDDEEDGLKIHATPEEQVAVGSGRSFAVRCGKKCDDGFQVTVNGTLKNTAGTPTSSFTTIVEVPPLNPPAPPEVSWEGDWQTEWTAGGDSKYEGWITFTRTSEGLSAKYDYGTIELKGSGNTLLGKWTETTAPAKLTLNPELSRRIRKLSVDPKVLSNPTTSTAGTSENTAGTSENTVGRLGNAACREGNVKFVRTGNSFVGRWGRCKETPKFFWRGTKL